MTSSAASPKVVLGSPPSDGGVSPELRTALLRVAEQLEFGWESHAAVVVVEAAHEHAFHEQLLELFLLELGSPAVRQRVNSFSTCTCRECPPKHLQRRT